MGLNEIFVDFLSTVADIPSTQIEKVVKSFHFKSVKRNTILLNQEDICAHFYFVSQGCLRTYYLTQAGHEKTRHIAFEGSVVTALSSFISQAPSFEFIDSLEQTDLYVINHHDFYQLTAQVPEWGTFYLKLLELAYVSQNKKMEHLVTLSAKQRYALYLKKYPIYVERLSNKILASYLNVSQETLSRVKPK